MPLIKGKSQKSFVKNLKTEMEHGKPQKQALAIAYSVMRKAKHHKMAEGGDPQKSKAQQISDSFKGAVGHFAEGGKPVQHDQDWADQFKKGAGFAKGGEACPTCGHDNKEDIVSKIMAKRKHASEKPMSLTDDLMNSDDMEEENVEHEMEGLNHEVPGNEEDDGDFVAKIMKKNKEKKAKFLGK